MSGPLHGIKVIDLTSVLMGPYATQILGDMGADIWKVESPAGDTTRRIGPTASGQIGPVFLHVNRNKRSIVLDLKTDAARCALHRAIEQADVLVYSVRPLAMRRLGLSYEDVRSINPQIIYAGATGFGQAGPYAARPAYDDLIQGFSALPTFQGGEDGPTYVRATIADRAVGLSLASAIGMALFHRERTGQGQAIEVPMFETMVQFVMGDHLYGHSYDPPRAEPGYPRLTEPARRPFQTQDGFICAVVYTDRHWQSLFELVGHPDLISDPRFASLAQRTLNMAALNTYLADTFLTRSSAEWLSLLDEADIPAGLLHDAASLMSDPHLVATRFIREIDHPHEGPIRTFGIPTTWSASQPDIRREAPLLGEHDEELLREWGCNEQSLNLLLRPSVLADSKLE